MATTGLYLTFEQWRHRGFHVKRGEKAHWIASKPKFNRHQVEENVQYVRSNTEYPVAVIHQDAYKVVYYADGSGYREASGPAGPLYFDKFGNT